MSPAGEMLVKTKIGWFLTGFVVSWLIWSAMTYSRYRPRDYTQAWDDDLAELIPHTEFHWLQNARGVRVGNYRVFTPADSSNASAQLQNLTDDGLPGIHLQDENSNGTMDSLLIVDSARRHFHFADRSGNGVFDSYEYTTGIGADSKTFRDDDMDGQYDFRLGPGRAMAVFIESKWRDVVGKETGHYVDLDGKLTRIEFYPVVRIVGDECGSRR